MILDFNQYLVENSASRRVAVGVAIIWNNKILLVHPTNGTWKKGICGIPKGGLEEGEDPLDGALRELYEETGITLTPAQLDHEPQQVTFFRGNRENGKLIYYVCKISELSEIGLESERIPKNQLQLEEIDWAKFVSPEEAYPIMSRGQLIILDRLLTLS
jgi:ADP-ribose pyrophosphatase YjhB (NUDIX family)